MPVHLVVGGNGTIGGALAERLRARGDMVYTTTRRPDSVGERCLFLDLAQPLEDWAPGFSYDTLFLCAGLDPSESLVDPEVSRKVNVTGPHALAAHAVRAGAFVVRLSTNAIFDGTQPYQTAYSPHRPLSLYGHQHSEADRMFLDLGPRAAVVRFTKVVGVQLALFRGWVEALLRGDTIRPLSDLGMAPITYPYIVELIERVGLARRPGVFQASGARDISFAHAAALLAKRLGVPEALVKPATMVECGVDPRGRARYATLAMDETEACFNVKPQSIEDALAVLVEAAWQYRDQNARCAGGG